VVPKGDPFLWLPKLERLFVILFCPSSYSIVPGLPLFVPFPYFALFFLIVFPVSHPQTGCSTTSSLRFICGLLDELATVSLFPTFPLFFSIRIPYPLCTVDTKWLFFSPLVVTRSAPPVFSLLSSFTLYLLTLPF